MIFKRDYCPYPSPLFSAFADIVKISTKGSGNLLVVTIIIKELLTSSLKKHVFYN